MRRSILLTMLFAVLFGQQINAQVSDNFDSYNSGDNPTGWTKYQTGSDDPGFVVTTEQANSAPNSLFHDDADINAVSTSWIVAPVYTATAGNDDVSFMYRQNFTDPAYGYYNYTGVWYSTTGTDPTTNPGDWTQLATFDGTDQPYSEDIWTEYRHTFTETAGTTIYVAFKYTGDYATEFYIDNFLIDVTPPYLPPTFNTTLDVDCANSQFSVNVNVTDLGGSTGVTITNDQGSASQQLTNPGTITYGPYPSGTTINFTVTSNNDNTINSAETVTYTCPSVPGDDCYNALTANVYAIGAGTGHEFNIDAATINDSGKYPNCDQVPANLDIWYKVTIPAGKTGFRAIFTGDKKDFVEAALWESCNSTTALVCHNNGTSVTAIDIFDGLTPGNTYYLQLWLDDINVGTYNFVAEEIPPTPDCVSNPTPTIGSTVTLETGRSLDLNWDLATTGPAPTHYEVQVGTTPGEYLVADVIYYANTLSLPLKLSHLSDNTTYYWKVTPINGGVKAEGCPEWTFTTQFPAPPTNDLCTNAMALTLDPNVCTTPTVVDNSFATDSNVSTPSCGNYNGGDLWFTVTVPASGSVSVETSEVNGAHIYDLAMSAYSGTCGSLTEIECNDDGGTNDFSKIELTGQNPGDILYVRVWEHGNNSFGEFNICAWNPNPSSIADNQIAGFKFYPNPVNNTLKLSAQNTIEKVSITNITGQEVLTIMPNTLETQVDMSKLKTGIYFVKAQVNGQVMAFKVVKK